MGHHGQMNHPEVQAVVNEIVTRALEAGKVVGDINDPAAAACRAAWHPEDRLQSDWRLRPGAGRIL